MFCCKSSSLRYQMKFTELYPINMSVDANENFQIVLDVVFQRLKGPMVKRSEGR